MWNVNVKLFFYFNFIFWYWHYTYIIGYIDIYPPLDLCDILQDLVSLWKSCHSMCIGDASSQCEFRDVLKDFAYL